MVCNRVDRTDGVNMEGVNLLLGLALGLLLGFGCDGGGGLADAGGCFGDAGGCLGSDLLLDRPLDLRLAWRRGGRRS